MFLSTFVVLIAASLVVAERSTLCDDGGPRTCSVELPDTLTDFRCGITGLWALQAGCYLCVDATTCRSLDSTLTLDTQEHKSNSLSLPKANGNDISTLLQAQAEHNLDEPAYEQAAARTNTNLGPQVDEKRPEVSNWLFAIPVCLAVVSLGLAIRNRIPLRRRGFKRLQNPNHHDQDTSPLFQEDINPFCSSEELDDNVVIETAGHFQGDSLSENEEAQFLPSEMEEDEFTQAESAAIKRAVLLHIKVFDEQEDEI